MVWPADVKPMHERRDEPAKSVHRTDFICFEFPRRVIDHRGAWMMTDPHGFEACREVEREITQRLKASEDNGRS